ncbi:MAG: polysaccharide biosynthesis/export family protein [Phycisphaerae bacterium]|nr:polysaccharide biosynthesis/export family protein [Phycisphaerae bacterium]
MTTVLVMVAVPSVLAGCGMAKTSLWQGLTNPTALVKSPTDPLTLAISPTASAADVDEELPPNATFPLPEDLLSELRDYRIGPEDMVDIGILDLYQEGLETLLRRQVSQSGIIDLPRVPSIKAEGLTSQELRSRIADAYVNAKILREPIVSVTVVMQRGSTFSIIGAVERPGVYNKTRPGMRLLEAVSIGGQQTMSNIRWIFVIRLTRAEANAAPAATGNGGPADDLPDLLPGLERPAEVEPDFDMPVPTEMSALAMGPNGNGEEDNADEPNVDELDQLMSGEETEESAEATLRTTRYVESAEGSAEAPQHETATGPQPTRIPAPIAAAPDDTLDWKNALGVDNVRLIAIDYRKLVTGSDPRLNIVIRENDTISVPVLEQAVFYVSGEVNRPGVYNLTGQKVTVKMALAAAGNVGPLAWPENAVLIRRIGPNQEQIIPLNIEKIMLGKQADYFLKADDVISVGTHALAMPMLVLRNAFRMTYGFGFIYDRNFAQPVPHGLDSHRFTRW